MISPRRLCAVCRKEFIHVLRDWRSLALAIAIPLLLLMLFGYALSLDLKNVTTLVWDQSQSPQSRELISMFEGSPYFTITETVSDYRVIRQRLDEGRNMIAVVIPGDFAQKLLAGKNVDVQVVADGSDANSTRLALGYVSAIARIFSEKVRAERISLSGLAPINPPVELRSRAFYNQNLRSQNAIIPGIVAIVMIVISAMLTSVTVAREWETGTMEQLIATPVKVPELVIGKVIPYFIIGFLDVAMAVAVGKWLFHVPFRGEPGLMFALASLFLTGALFYGLALSIATKSQVLANQIALLSSFLPSMMLSGFMFAIADMPWLIQKLTYIVPARYFITVLRGIYLKGIGLEILWSNALLLLVYAVLMVLLAHKRLKLTLE